MSRRGNVKYLRSDNGTNFVGADNELKLELQKIDINKVKDFLVGKDCSWIEWEFNPPKASHHGGVWERQIRSAKQILHGILLNHGKALNDESLRTLLCEVENVLIMRPLTVQCLNDPMSLAPLSPTNLLTTKSDIVLPLLETLTNLMSSLVDIGKECNISAPTNFGNVGEKNF